jgi:hypothetical protein
MLKRGRARFTLLLALVLLPATTAAGCAPAASGAGSATRPAASSVASRTAPPPPPSNLGRVYSLGETVTVGPYTVCLTRVRFIRSPKAGPDLFSAPKIPKGKLLATLDVRVGNPASAQGEAAPMPELETFSLKDERGSLVASDTGVGFSPAPPADDDTQSPWGGPPTRDIQPGDSMTINPQFIVSAASTSLTLYYSPLKELPDAITKFRVK